MRTATMRAVVLREPGPVANLEIRELTVPAPGPGWIRIWIKAFGLAAIGVAREIGATALATTCSASRAPVLEGQGAIALVDDGNVAAQVRALYPDGVDASCCDAALGYRRPRGLP